MHRTVEDRWSAGLTAGHHARVFEDLRQRASAAVHRRGQIAAVPRLPVTQTLTARMRQARGAPGRALVRA